MKTLALEFSSARRSVAILDGTTVLAVQAESVGDNVPPLTLIERVLAAAHVARGEVGCLVVGLGPGSYTGIRGGIALAQGWQLANNVKLLGVDSAQAVAVQAAADGLTGRVSVVIDAQRGEFYAASFDLASSATVTPCAAQPLRLVSADEVRALAAAGEKLIGPDAKAVFPEALEIFPTATALGRLAARRTDFISGENLEPVYLRATTFVKAAPARSTGA